MTPNRRKVRRLVTAFGLFVGAALVVLFIAGDALLGGPKATDGRDLVPRDTWTGAARFAWADQGRLPAPFSDEDGGAEPAFSSSGLDIYFSRRAGDSNGGWDLFRARWTPDGYQPPEPLFELNSSSNERDPHITRAGTMIVFASDRPGGVGGYDLYASAITADGFGAPLSLGPTVNSEADDRGPTADALGRTLVFASNRLAIDGVSYDLFESSSLDGTWGPPSVISTFQRDNDGETRGPAMSPDGRFLVFAADRQDARGGYDLYRSVRSGKTWRPATPIGELNSELDELDPAFSSEGTLALFSRGRAGSDALKTDICLAERRELIPVDGENPVSDQVIRWLGAALILILCTYLGLYWNGIHPFVKFVVLSALVHLIVLLYVHSRPAAAEEGGGATDRAFVVSYIPTTTDDTDEERRAPSQGDRVAKPARTVLATPSPAVQLVPRSAPTPTAARSVGVDRDRTRPTTEPTLRPRTIRRRSGIGPAMVATAKGDASETSGQKRGIDRAPPITVSSPAVINRSPVTDARSRPSRRSPTTTSALSPPREGPPIPRFDNGPSRSGVVFSRSPPPVGPSVIARSSASTVPVASPVATSASENARRKGTAVARTKPSRPAPSDVAIARQTTRLAGNARPSTTRPVAAAPGLTPRGTATGVVQRRTDRQPAEDVPPPVTSAVARSPSRRTALQLPVTRATEVASGRPRSELGAPPTSMAAPRPRSLQSNDRARPGAVVAHEAPRPRNQETARARAPSTELPWRRTPPIAQLPGTDSVTRTRSTRRPARTIVPAAAERATSAPRPPEQGATSSTLRPAARFTIARETTRNASGRGMRPAPTMGAVGGRASPPPGDLITPRHPAMIGLGPATAAGAHTQRTGSAKRLALRSGGGSERTEAAVLAGLRYLRTTQRRNGSWGRDTGHEKYGDFRIGKTGLSLLAFLGSGYTHEDPGEFRDCLGRGLAWLMEEQSRDGHFGDAAAYGHGIATYALAEAYAMTRDAGLRRPLVRAVRRILEAQVASNNRRIDGGWSYYYRDLERTYDRWPRMSVSVWQIMALKSAKIGGIPVPPEAFIRARSFVQGAFDGRLDAFRYNHDPEWLQNAYPTLPGTTPAALFALQLLGVKGGTRGYSAGLAYIDRRPPMKQWRRYSDRRFATDGSGNLYYLYYATLARFFDGGPRWQRWNQQLSRLLVESQSDDGSWRPISYYAEYAADSNDDRAYTTAMCVLMLEVYYRYFTPLLTSMDDGK